MADPTHYWGGVTGWSNGHSRKTKSTDDTGAGYTRTGDETTRDGGQTNVTESEYKFGRYGFSVDGHGATPVEGGTRTFNEHWTENGNTTYRYANVMDTSYAGAAGSSTYAYAESDHRNTWGTGSSSTYDSAAGESHSGSSEYSSEKYHYIDDAGTQDPDGTIHNGVLLGVRHRELDYREASGTSDGVSWSDSQGSPDETEWHEWSAGTQGWIDWAHDVWTEWGETVLDGVQTAVDVATMFAPPGVGAALALANAGISLARGKEVDWVDVCTAPLGLRAKSGLESGGFVDQHHPWKTEDGPPAPSFGFPSGG